MNGTEQRNHRTAVQQLAADTEVVIEALARRINAKHDSTVKLVDDERNHRIKLADEQRTYVDRADKELRACCDTRWAETGAAQQRIISMSEPLRRTLLGRLRWLFRGI